MNVSLFIPCVTDMFFPESGMNMARVLERLGQSVSYRREQTCCGQPAFNMGYHDDAAVLAERFLRLFEDAETIVAPSGSCVTMVKRFYASMVPLSAEFRARAAELAGRIHEFTSFLVDILGVDEVGAVFPHRVAVHDSCHALRELGIKRQPRALLARVRGLDLVEMDQPEVCCGFGGTFSVKFADLSSAMADEKTASIARSGAEVVTGVDASCLMQIGGRLRRQGSAVRAIHIADILAGGG